MFRRCTAIAFDRLTIASLTPVAPCLALVLSVLAITLTQMVLNQQKRHEVALHLKIDELIHAMKGARDEVMGIESKSEVELEALRITGDKAEEELAQRRGKSVVTTALCRAFARRGVKVAPFKAQNMSNNSVVVVGADGRGGEIGRAQAMQAAACGIAPDIRFNPVLLKPGSDFSSQVVLLGQAIDTVTAGNYRSLRPRLAVVDPENSAFFPGYTTGDAGTTTGRPSALSLKSW